MTILDLENVGEDLSRLVERALADDNTVISRYGMPVAKLVRVGEQPRPQRKVGLLEGLITTTSDFDDALPDDILAAFEGR